MIHSNGELNEAHARCNEKRIELDRLKHEYHAQGLSANETERKLEPYRVTLKDLERAIAEFERKQNMPCAEATAGQWKILLLEDNKEVRDLFAEILTAHGYRINGVATAAEAFKSLPEFEPDLIISGIQMPGDDGYTFVKKLRKLEPDAGGLVPVIAVTSTVAPEAHFQEAGFQDYLCKPFQFHELLEVVEKCLARQKQR